jgi:hypothetical protein
MLSRRKVQCDRLLDTAELADYMLNAAMIGASHYRLGDDRLAVGRGRFVADVRVDGMLHAAVLRSDVSKRRMRAGQEADARRWIEECREAVPHQMNRSPGLRPRSRNTCASWFAWRFSSA